jgi:hypothetical protein
MVEFHDPRGVPSEPPHAYQQRLDPTQRPLSLALTSIDAFESTTFLETLAEVMTDRFEGIDARVFVSINYVWSEEDLDQILRSQASVAAYGHCGGCTSATMRDATMIAKTGRPAVALITSPFWEVSKDLARGYGVPDVPRLQLPYPIAGSGRSGMRALAARIAPEVMALLVQSATP